PFVVAGDNRPAKATYPLTQPLLDTVARLAAHPPAFVVWDGDSVFGKRETGIAAQYAEFLGAMRTLPVPLFNAPGNHELVVQTNIPCGTKDDPWNAELPDWSGSMAATYSAAMSPAYGMFRYANRLTQFRSLIDNAAHPKVTFVFASHDHRLFVYPTPSDPDGPFTRTAPATDNPTFIVTGGAGAPLTGCNGTTGPAGSYFHYMTVAVDGPTVTVSVNPLYGTTPCLSAPQPAAAR